MPRNTLKTFPTAALRRGLAHFHPACLSGVQPPLDPPGTQHARLSDVDPREPISPATSPFEVAPSPEEIPVIASLD